MLAIPTSDSDISHFGKQNLPGSIAAHCHNNSPGCKIRHQDNTRFLLERKSRYNRRSPLRSTDHLRYCKSLQGSNRPGHNKSLRRYSSLMEYNIAHLRSSMYHYNKLLHLDSSRSEDNRTSLDRNSLHLINQLVSGNRYEHRTTRKVFSTFTNCALVSLQLQ